MLSELIPIEKSNIHKLQVKVNELERHGGQNSIADLDIEFKAINSKLEMLDSRVNNESKAQREGYRRKMESLKQLYNHALKQFENYKKRNYYNFYQAQRNDLFSGSYNNADFDVENAESQSLENSTKMVNEYLHTGRETLNELMNQKERLKAVQAKAYDILNLLGLSGSLIKAIEKRENQDKLLVFAGMFFILLLIGFIYFYLKR